MITHTVALDEVGRVWAGLLADVGEQDLVQPSGCAQWTNRELINHVVGGGHRYAILLRGGGEADVAATRSRDYLVDDDLVGPFWLFENDFRGAMASADLDVDVDHRAGARSGRELVDMRVMELALHAYDLAVGLGDVALWTPSDALVEYVLATAVPILDEFRAIGFVGEAADPVTERPADLLLARSGRGRR